MKFNTEISAPILSLAVLVNYYWTDKMVIILLDISKKKLLSKLLKLEMFQDQHFVSPIKLLIINQKFV